MGKRQRGLRTFGRTERSTSCQPRIGGAQRRANGNMQGVLSRGRRASGLVAACSMLRGHGGSSVRRTSGYDGCGALGRCSSVRAPTVASCCADSIIAAGDSEVADASSSRGSSAPGGDAWEAAATTAATARLCCCSSGAKYHVARGAASCCRVHFDAGCREGNNYVVSRGLTGCSRAKGAEHNIVDAACRSD